jgi:hypothetical protein
MQNPRIRLESESPLAPSQPRPWRVGELVSTRTGTEVHHVADGRLFGIFNIMQPLVAWMARGERERTVHALKDSLEREALE